jgi:hypothetical protein
MWELPVVTGRTVSQSCENTTFEDPMIAPAVAAAGSGASGRWAPVEGRGRLSPAMPWAVVMNSSIYYVYNLYLTLKNEMRRSAC